MKRKKNILGGLFFCIFVIFLLSGSALSDDELRQVVIVPKEARIQNPCEDIGPPETISFYYDNGESIFQEISCHGQKKYGLFRQFYPDGALWIEENYSEGKLDGLSQTFYQNGNLKRYAKYHLGAISEEVEFDRDGNAIDFLSDPDVFTQETLESLPGNVSPQSPGVFRPTNIESEWWR